MGSFLGLRKGRERREKETLWVVVGCFSMVKALSRLWLVLPYSIAKALWVVVGCFFIAKALTRLWLVVSLLSKLSRL
ncbi:hypothetical protein AMTRI_Chr11g157890 [Amborella trichopoda]